MNNLKYIKIIISLIITILILSSCSKPITVNKKVTDQFFTAGGNVLAFDINTSKKSIDYSFFSDWAGKNETFNLHAIKSPDGKLTKITHQLVADKIESKEFRQGGTYLAKKAIGRNLRNKNSLLNSVSKSDLISLRPEICHFIYCSNETFYLDNFINEFPDIQRDISALAFKDKKMAFPPIPLGAGGSNICDQCNNITRLQLPDEDDFDTVTSKCDLVMWLENHPEIRNAIIWRKDNALTYDAWSPNQKQDLQRAFNKIKDKTNLYLNSEPPHTIYNPTGDVYYTLFSESDAWEYYIAYLAHTLYLEICEKISWSILDYPTETLHLILDSRSMFEYIKALDKWAIVKLYVNNNLFHHGMATQGNPMRIYTFLKNEGILDIDPQKTVENMIEWCRDNMSHYYYGDDPANLLKHWGYDGFPPVESIIAGTTHPEFGFSHWTAGCWGTTGFLSYVLRTINIPVELNKVECPGSRFHALPGFPTLGKYLSHGDDPYTKTVKEANASGEDLLIDVDSYKEWFIENPSSCENIGRRAREIGMQ